MKKSLSFIILLAPALFLTGCFTGIESTPKITSSDVKKENILITAEQEFLSDIKTPSPGKWQEGKRFHITDKRIKLILDSSEPLDTSKLQGREMVFEGIDRMRSVTGEDKGVMRFMIEGGQEVSLNTNMAYDKVMQVDSYEIPFAVDHDILVGMSDRLKGNTYYIITPNWYDINNGKAERGLRHIPVEIVDVQPGTWAYPIRVVFRPKDADEIHSVLMTFGDKRSSTQNFDTLFAFENPRNKYPAIEEDTWQLIINSKVKIGMTKDECRLALGAPSTRGQIPTTAGMVEYWSYAEGIYLLFEDGYLSRVR